MIDLEMKILAIGDPHGNLEKIKSIPLNGVDLILLTGDLGSASLMRKMAFENVERQKQGLEEREYSPKDKKRAFMEAYESSLKVVRYLAKFAPVYTIYGNVEISNAETRRKSKEIGLSLPFLSDSLEKIDGVGIINNKLANFGGLRIGGLRYFVDKSWVADFRPGDYKERMKRAIKDTKKAKDILDWFGTLDILVHHQPPYGYLDKVGPMAPKSWQGKHAGSKLILDYINKMQPRYTFCGHIPEGEGMERIGKTEVYNLGVGGYKIIDL